MKIILLFVLTCFYSLSAFSQPKMELSGRVHDFGRFKESEGRKTHTFQVTNTGTRPLVIQNIVPSCGCTTPDWTKTPIPPKGKGIITAIFDPADRGGIFSKTLTVYNNSDPPVTVLTLKGEVIPRERSPEEDYTWPIGQVRFEGQEISFSGMVKTQKKIRVMPVINTSGEDVKIEFVNLPAHLTMKTVPLTIKPGQRGLVECTYNAMKDLRWGIVKDLTIIKLNGAVQQKGLYVSANLVEDFSTLSREERANSPVIKPVSNRLDLGIMEQSSSANAEFRIKNEGKRELLIRDVRSSCECIIVRQGIGSAIKPGESGSVIITLNSGDLSGSQTKSLYVYSNDPANSQSILLVHAEIKPKAAVKK